MNPFKIKVTWLDYSGPKARFLIIPDWYQLTNVLMNNGVNLNQILKVEVLLEIEADNAGAP